MATTDDNYVDNLFVVCLSVTKRGSFSCLVTSVNIHNASHGPIIVKSYWSADLDVCVRIITIQVTNISVWR